MVGADHPSSDKKATSAGRKLTAIFHADVVGFSRLMSEDEAGTHAQLIAHRQIIEQHISSHNGRIVGTAGDSVLADFSSVVDALSAAVDIQNALSEQNAPVPVEQKLEFRIGINLGDVIVDGEDIFGDGVNVAARLESLADPGGIAISGAVYDQVKNKMDLDFDDRGNHQVKNIAEPVHVYAVCPIGSPTSKRQVTRTRWRKIHAIAGSVFVLAALMVFWLCKPAIDPDERVETPQNGDTSVIASKPAGTPTIAVLPFKNRSGEEGQAYFSDGITEDVITDLGRFSNLFVLSWNAVAPYKDQEIHLKKLSQDLNVRYVVGGTVHRVADRLRITVQLTDARRGVLLYSERFDENIKDIFVVQDQITRQVVGTLAVRLTELEQARAFKKPTKILDAYDHVLRGRNLLRRIERSANLDARAMFERAIEIDAQYVDAYVGLGWSHMNDFWYGWTEWPQRAIERAHALAEQAIGFDARNASVHTLLASVLTFQRRYQEAEQEIDRAIRLNPNNAISHAIRGVLMMWSGNPNDAVPALEFALRLDPAPIAQWLLGLSQSYYFLKRYDDAIRLLNRFEHRFNEDPAPYALLAASHGQLGQIDQATRALDKLKRISPFFNAKIYAGNLANPVHGRHLLEGLSKAGMEE
jgi:class 3 adenylate cyclase/TolB-like protein/Flp pilus assembly protein TadD